MKAKKRTITLPLVLGVRLTHIERKSIEAAANAAKSTASEWSRRTLLQAVDVSSEARLLLAEILALRKILILLMKDQCDGRNLSNDGLREAVEQAEATKFAMAESRIRQLSVQQPKPEEKVHG
jgi:formate-dependent nitrite reductase cytochrome c552 subunit